MRAEEAKKISDSKNELVGILRRIKEAAEIGLYSVDLNYDSYTHNNAIYHSTLMKLSDLGYHWSIQGEARELNDRSGGWMNTTITISWKHINY